MDGVGGARNNHPEECILIYSIECISVKPHTK